MTQVRSLWGHVMVLVVWASGFYSLILNPYELDDLAKGAFIGFMGLALQWEFGSAIASATARQQQTALNTPAPIAPPAIIEESIPLQGDTMSYREDPEPPTEPEEPEA